MSFSKLATTQIASSAVASKIVPTDQPSSSSAETTKLPTLDHAGFGKLPLLGNGDWDYIDGNEQNNHLYSTDGLTNVVNGFGGNDYIFASDNDSDGSGMTAQLYGGDGNDTIQVWADHGGFLIDTGTGQDHVLISNSATHVSIQNYDGTDAGDTFEFSTGFRGTADVWSFDDNDRLMWNTVNSGESVNAWQVSHVNGDTTFHNANTNGTITFHGADVEKTDTGVHFGPTANFPLGGYMIFLDFQS